MEKFCGVPLQPFKAGVTVRLATCGVAPVLVDMNVNPPVPLAANPMAVFELVQVKTAPLVPLKPTARLMPAQTVWLSGGVTMGVGLTLMLKFWAAPTHPCALGVTVRLASSVALTLAAVKLISPVPVAPNPMLMLLFVQLKFVPAVPVNATFTTLPPHTVWLIGAVTVGIGLTVIVKLTGAPIHPFKMEVTEIFPTSAVVPVLVVVKLKLPAPLAPKPIAVSEFVQLKFAPAVPLKLTETLSPTQAAWSVCGFVTGNGFTVRVTGVRVLLVQLEEISRVSA